MRIPLLSDLAGHKITGADLVAFFDPDDGPTIKGFLAFVNQLYHLVDLVHQVASAGRRSSSTSATWSSSRAIDPGDSRSGALGDLRQRRSTSGCRTACRATLRDISALHDLDHVALPGSLPSPSTEGGDIPDAANEFSHGVSQEGGIDFPILDNPSILFNLLLGKPVKLVEITLPELSFSFFYRQEFPIIGPLVGTFEGGFSAKLDLRLGYDTQGLQRVHLDE